jgi:hypothetical protein
MVYRQPPRVFYSSAFFVLVMTLIVFMKPSSVFLQDGSLRPFGTSGKHHTLMSIGVIVVISALISLFIFAWIDLATSPSVSVLNA